MKLLIVITQELARQSGRMSSIAVALPKSFAQDLQTRVAQVPANFPKLRIKLDLSLVTDDGEIVPLSISSNDLERFISALK